MAVSQARKVALLALVEMEKKGAFINLSLRELMRGRRMKAVERAFATQLAMGVAKMRLYLDYLIERLCERRFHRLTPLVLNCLRMGAYELTVLSHPPYAVVSQYVELAKEYGHVGIASLVNAVLRRLSEEWQHIPLPRADEDPIGHIAVKTSHPHWLVEKWIKQFGFEETVALCAANNLPAPLCIRVNLRWTEVELVERMLELRCRKVERARYAPCGLRIDTTMEITKLPGYKEGLFSVQDEAAMLVTYVLEPKHGETIIDACAAPGGKTTHMAEMVNDAARIIAVDVHEGRMQLVREAAIRLKLRSIEFVVGDFIEVAKQHEGVADKCLLDVPCSGTGTLRRKPDARWKKSQQSIAELTALQLRLLEAAALTVKRGGVIVYSTCSLEREEDEDVVNAFLRAHDEFEIEDASAYLPTRIEGCRTEEGFVRLFPHKHDTDGVFVARLRKVG
ncbi:MAG: 16S rRNA (cytosine(967)-C(5))-methyltransferase RsmB [Armatimonadota bacterium]|nr:16S rRNA (cytosine(967)-C(5))-methyltransferase RsmB [Armatimonadota bacterium]MCX7777394.1 16S rRNA (cytosine(967)-C(5))-methyltransferase RsmB [Armatimonadota bacterium]MDW8025063.1 16S rRNA (cytosine(967)-C(5))-methyltransferase RsmB [Armatimonadota bacterium]